jgi:hypothetical protein
MKETFIWAKSLYSWLLIQPNLVFCLRLDSWSRGKSIDHNPRKPSICLNFSSLNKSWYGSASVSKSNPIARKAPICWAPSLSLWSRDISSLSIWRSLFRLRKAIRIPGAVWEHKRGSHQELKRFELYLMQKLGRALVPRWEDRWYHHWHDLTRTIIHQ